MKTISLRLDDELWKKLDLACSNKTEFLSAILKEALERDVIVIKGEIRYWGSDPVRVTGGTITASQAPMD